MPGAEVLDFLAGEKFDSDLVSSLQHDLERSSVMTAEALSLHVAKTYEVDLSGEFAGIPIHHPIGKAAGQLSMTPGHVDSDNTNGLAFTVLKSAVGITPSGEVGISDWEKSAPKMIVEKRRSLDGRDGWTVTWRGRGWDKGFEAYVDFYRTVLDSNHGYLVIPSLMVDVTSRERAAEQAANCLGQLIDVFGSAGSEYEFLVEIDISPTLNLLPGADDDRTFRRYVAVSVDAFRKGLNGRGKCIVKIPNGGRDADFQVRLVQDSLDIGGGAVKAVIAGNRLFDKSGEFEGQVGIAYGGWDLSNINLMTLDGMKNVGLYIPVIATGNICSGKIMAEYAVRGCLAGEIHTFFQLKPSAYRAPSGEGGLTWRALREIIFHPDDGLVAIMMKLEKTGILPRKSGLLCFKSLPGCYRAVRGAI